MLGYRLGTVTYAARAAKGPPAGQALGRARSEGSRPWRDCGSGRHNDPADRVPPDPVDAVQQKPVGFLPMAGHREGGKSATGPSRHIRSIIDNAGVESQKLIEASPIQRQFFDLLLADQSGGR